MKGLRYGMVAWTIALFCVSLPSAALDPAACDAKFQTVEGGMVGYWTFDDMTDPTAADYGSVHGTNHGALWTDLGAVGGALDYDGHNHYVDLGTSIDVPAWSSYSIAVWFLNDGDGEENRGYGSKIFAKETMFHNAAFALLPTYGNLIFQTYEAGDDRLSTAHPGGYNYWGDDTWHLAIIVKEGGSGELWIDGVLQDEQPLRVVHASSEPLLLGYSSSSDGYSRVHWGGMIDEFAIFDRALTHEEINDLYASSSAGAGYCGRTVELDATAQSLGATVDIRYGPAGLGDGDTFDAGAAYQYRVNIGGFSGGWLTGPSTPVLEIDENDEYAVQTMAMDVTLPWTTSVDIRFGTDNDGLLEGGSFAVPMGDYQYRVNACGLTGPWKDFSVAASGDLVVYSGSDVAEIGVVSSDPTITVDVRYGEDNDGLMDGDRFCAPSPTTVQYRVGAGGYSGNWLDLEIAGDEVLLVTEGDQYATVTVLDVPTGGAVDIRYGEANDGLGNGATFLSPNMQDRQWRLCVSGHCSGWIDYTVSSPYQLSVSEGQAYAEIGIDLSTAMGLSGAALYVADPSARIDIRYGVSDLPHDAIVTLPCTTVQWRLKTEGGSLKGPWTSHDVCGVGDIVPIAGADAMELQFNFDWTTSKYAKTAVRYVRTVTNCNDTGTHCERLVAPCGTNVQARPDLGNISPPWLAAPVDCGWDTWTWHMGAETTDGAPQ